MTTDAATVARLAHISDEEMSEDIDDLIALLERYAGPAREDLKLRAASALREQRDEIAKWRELHRVVAEELGATPEAWPDHGNAPLAIAATFMLHKQAAERAEAACKRAESATTEARTKLRAETERAKSSDDAWRILCGGKQKIIEQLQAERDALLDAAIDAGAKR